MALNFLKTLDADDIFISYSREDGSAYLNGLDAALSARGFSCFTDRRGTDAGKLPPATLFNKIRKCKTLVLLATPGALNEPENIEPEVKHFAEANGTSRIVCVSFDRDAEFAEWSNTPWYNHVEGKAREREDPNTLKTGEPSTSVIESITVASNYMKSKDRLRKYRNRALWVLAGLVIAIIGTGIVAGFMSKRAAAALQKAVAATQKASEETAKADQASRDAETALKQARAAEVRADSARIAADKATTEAAEQKRIGDKATEDAKQATALAATQKALAQRQSTIAKVLQLANNSQTVLRQRPEAVAQSLTRAVQAMELSNSLNSHIREADTAIREGLTLLPRRQKNYEYSLDTIVALSPDGQYFATNSDNKLRIYASGSKTPLKEIACDCSAVALSSGLTYAVGVTGEGVKIFDLKGGSSHVLNNLAPNKIAISPGGKYLALSFLEGEDLGTYSILQVLDAATGNTIKSFEDLETKINYVAFGLNGSLAVGGTHVVPRGGRFIGRVVIWTLNPKNSEDEPVLKGDAFPAYEAFPVDSEVWALALAPDGASFATDKIVWKKSAGRIRYVPVAVLPHSTADETESAVKLLAFSRDSRSLTVVRDIRAVGQSVEDEQEVLELWDASGYKELARVSHSSRVISVGFTSADRIASLTGESGYPTQEFESLTSKEFEALTGKEVTTIVYRPGPADGEVKYVSRNEGYVVSILNDLAVLWDVWRRNKQAASFAGVLKKVDVAAVSPGGKFLALAGEGTDGRQFVVYRSDGAGYTEWKRIPNQSEPPEMMALSADGQRLAVLHHYDPSYVRVWDISNKRDVTPESLRFKHEVETESFGSIPDIRMIALSPGGHFLVTTDRKNRTRLLDLSRGQTAEMMALLDGTGVESIAFSRDERYLGIGSDADEALLHVFDTNTTEGVVEIALLQHSGNVTAVSFSDDSRYVATATGYQGPYSMEEEEGSPVRIWLLQPRDLIEEATARLAVLSPGKR